MISDAEVRLAEWILQQSCRERKICGGCPHGKSCPLCDNHKCPDDWDIPTIPPDPTERQRIEWLRMLPDDEMLFVMNTKDRCDCCKYYWDCYSSSDCNSENNDWWHEVVTLGQFKKDVGLA